MTARIGSAAAAERLREMGLVDPTDRPAPRQHRPAPRLSSLHGRRAGFLDNRKTNGDVLLACLSALLAERFELAGTLWQAKFIYSREAEAPVLEALTEGADFVITAIGD